MLSEHIKTLHKLHFSTLKLNHIIEYERGAWKMFEPSKFIYSFFTFNSVYSINWQESIQQNNIIDDIDSFQNRVIDNKIIPIQEKDKINALVIFIFNIYPKMILLILEINY